MPRLHPAVILTLACLGIMVCGCPPSPVAFAPRTAALDPESRTLFLAPPLRALDADSNVPQWSAQFPNAYIIAFARHLFVATAEGAMCDKNPMVLALDSGRVVNRFSGGPLAAAGEYVLLTNGDILHVPTATRTGHASFDRRAALAACREDNWPLMAPDRVTLPLNEGQNLVIRQFSLPSGKQRWHISMKSNYFAPVGYMDYRTTIGDMLIFSANRNEANETLTAYDVPTRQVAWTCSGQGASALLDVPRVGRSGELLPIDPRPVVINPFTGKREPRPLDPLIERIAAPSPRLPAPMLYRHPAGILALAQLPDDPEGRSLWQLSCYDATTGKLRWQRDPEIIIFLHSSNRAQQPVVPRGSPVLFATPKTLLLPDKPFPAIDAATGQDRPPPT